MRLARRRFPCQYTVPMGRQTAGLEGNGQAAVRPPAVLASAATGIVEDIERQGGDVEARLRRRRSHRPWRGLRPCACASPPFAPCSKVPPAAPATTISACGSATASAPATSACGAIRRSRPRLLGCAIENLVELFPLHQESSLMRLVAGNSLGRLEYQITAPSILERRQDAELSLGMFLNVFRECLGARWVPEEIHFEHPRPEGFREHERAFGAPVYFSQATNAHPVPLRNPRPPDARSRPDADGNDAGLPRAPGQRPARKLVNAGSNPHRHTREARERSSHHRGDRCRSAAAALGHSSRLWPTPGRRTKVSSRRRGAISHSCI